MRLDVDFTRTTGEFDHFWRSTGFTPAKLLRHDDMRQTIAYLGAVPNDGISHVRIHFLLDLIRIGGDPLEGTPRYDWSKLDEGLDVLVENGLRPFFELMGNPSNAFDDFTDRDQLRAWRRFVRDLGDHLASRYGIDEVESWYFESWNEPDIGFGWEQFASDPDAFCAYYDACSAGLRDANPTLTLGGPGTARTRSSLFERFLEHCDTGTNCLTGDEVRLDFVSVHEKGASSNREDLTPDTSGIVAREREAIEYVRERHPGLADRPFANNECDPQTGWNEIHTWRARPYYAAIVTKIIDQHRRELVDGTETPYVLLSNDNGFLGTWGNRTHFARLGEGEGELEIDPNGAGTRPTLDEFELVKKPSYTVMTLLSLLGDTGLELRRSTEDPATPTVGGFATRRGEESVTVLLYNVRDRPATDGETNVTLALENLPFDDGIVAHYRIDDEHANPFAVWDEAGGPTRPSADLRRALRASHGAELLAEPTPVDDDRVELSVELPLPSVSVVHVRDRPGEPPATPTGLRADPYRGIAAGTDVMFTWDANPARAVRTYEVCRIDDGGRERLNDRDLLAAGYYHAGTDPAGTYAVRTVDYWGRASKLSDPITLE